jgi:hypothetical protein
MYPFGYGLWRLAPVDGRCGCEQSIECNGVLLRRRTADPAIPEGRAPRAASAENPHLDAAWCREVHTQ